MVRAVMAFHPAVISPEGRIWTAEEDGSPALLIHDVETLDVETFYTKHGDLFALACAVMALGGLLIAALGRSGIRTEEV